MELNNKILRILQNAPRDTKVVHFYNNFNTLTLPNLHKFNILLFVNKFFHRRHQLLKNSTSQLAVAIRLEKQLSDKKYLCHLQIG